MKTLSSKIVMQGSSVELDVVELDSHQLVPAVLHQATQYCTEGDHPSALALLTEEQLEHIRQGVGTYPERFGWLFMTADLLVRLEQFSTAVEWFEDFVQRHPCAVGYYRLAQSLQVVGRLGESVDCARKAVQMDPTHGEFLSFLGQGLFDLGNIENGYDAACQACELAPGDPLILSRRLGIEHYLGGKTRHSFQADYQRMGRLISRGCQPIQDHGNVPSPDRRLRVGVLSPFFRTNSVAYAFEPLLDGMDSEAIELIGYSLLPSSREDGVTTRMRSKFSEFHPVMGLSTSALVDKIQQDQIDILVEIAGYVGGHRMDVMACKPAPVQVDIGAVDTTGLVQIDYRLTDQWLDPWELPHPYTETCVYLPHGCQCYRPFASPPVASVLPMVAKGYATFGAFHDHRKISETSLKLWAQILKRLPEAHLVIKCRDAFDQTVCHRLRNRCRVAGCDIERIDIIGWPDHGDHLQLLNQIDLMLDTTPHSGSIMTMEALWMGVPTVTLAGDLYMSRMGVLALDRVGLDLFIAQSEQEYIDKAVSFIQQPEAMAQLRQGLRTRMLRSPLCDAKLYASEVCQAFRYMWHRWCRSQGVHVGTSEPQGWFREPE